MARLAVERLLMRLPYTARVKRLLVAVCVVLAVAACGSIDATTPSPTALPPVAAQVGPTTIYVAQLNLRIGIALVQLQQAGAPTPSSLSDPMLDKLRASVLRGLVDDAVIGQGAVAAHVAVTESDIDAEVQRDASSAGGMDALQTQLAQAGGSLDSLRDEIGSRINEQNLENVFAQQRAAQVIASLGQGQSFATLAPEFSDDQTSIPKGGDLGAISTATLNGDDPMFKAIVIALHVGQLTTAPVRDAAGYEILRLDAIGAGGYSVHRILVAAPNPYTVRERPAWFQESLVSALLGLCNQNQVHVLIPGAPQLCVPASPSPSP